MRKLRPEYLKKNGRTEFVVLTVEDYEEMRETIEEARDLVLIREARRRNGKSSGISLQEMKRRLGLNKARA